MRAAFTCQQCLGLIRSGPSCVRVTPRAASGLQRRCSYWQSRPRAKRSAITTSIDLRTDFSSTRPASSLQGHGQMVKDEPVEIASPSGLESTPLPEVSGRALLQPNNLFHHFSSSPSAEIRQRAAFIKQHAFCPHPDHHQTRLPTSPDRPGARKTTSAQQRPAHVGFECPDCGIPVYCSEEHWADDYESHMEICETLREINEDDHDLRSGRFFPEFEYPGAQMEEALVNMTNWDTYLYSRDFRAINDERSLRQATRLLTYPLTIGSVLHELSPYSVRSGGRLTPEGLKSLSGKEACEGPCSHADARSAPVHPASATDWGWLGHQRPATEPAASADLHPGRESRVVSATRSMGSAVAHLSTRRLPSNLYRSREHGKPRW